MASINSYKSLKDISKYNFSLGSHNQSEVIWIIFSKDDILIA